ncbi:MAG: hypothetical protein ACK5QT_05190, partial [Oligoflexia bacterium]
MFKRYLKLLFAAAVYACVVHLALPFRSLEQAALLHLIQVFLPASAGVMLLAGRGAHFEGSQLSRYLMGLAMLLLSLCDATYFTTVHVLGLDSQRGWLQWVVTYPYHLVFFMASLALVFRQSGFVATMRNSRLWLSVGLAATLSFPFVVYPTYLSLSQSFQLVRAVGAFSALCCSLALLSSSLFSFLNSRSLDSALLACGWFAFGMTDWTIQVGLLEGDRSAVNFNSFLWTVSGVIASLPLLFKESEIEVSKVTDADALAGRLRLRLLLALLVPMVLLSLTFGSTRYGVVVLSFGLIFGTVAITLAIQFVLEAVADVSRALSRVGSGGLRTTGEFRGIPSELRLIISEVMERTRGHAVREQAIRNQALEERRRLVEQVAHDVRSPLAALEMVAAQLQELPEDRRVMIRSAVGRIKEIANNLLQKKGANGSGEASAGSQVRKTSCQLLSSIVDEIVTEKRFQY